MTTNLAKELSATSSDKTGGLIQSTQDLPAKEGNLPVTHQDAETGHPPASEERQAPLNLNLRYLFSVRGIMNFIHLSCSVITLSLLSESCQYRPNPSSPVEGFYCAPPETFLFVTSCGAFFTSFLFLLSCVCSKQTSHLLYRTAFEAFYFIFYFILLLISSFSLMISFIYWSEYRISSGKSHDTTKTSIIFGLMDALCYGISALWFFMIRCYYNQQFLT